MLLLNRVRLVNWHFYNDSIVELGPATLLAGDNGSGKSTVIDAIQYALVANIGKIQFNSAASQNRRSRSLESYCRCKIGAENVDYIRDNTITHVILEFKEKEKMFLSGIAVEAFKDSDIKETLWILEQGRLEDVNVIEGNELIRVKVFKERLKGAGGIICSTKREYNSKLTYLLNVHRRNIDFNPYLEALVRSVSFTPFTSIDQFVCNYILEERQVDISAMRENLQNYKEAEKEAFAMEQKIDALKKIEAAQEEAYAVENQIIMQEFLKKRVINEIIDLKIIQNRENESKIKNEINSSDKRIESGKEREERQENLRQEYTFALAENDQHRLYERLNRDRAEINNRLNTEEQHAERFKTVLNQCETMLDRKIEGSLEECRHELDNEREEKTEKRAGVRTELKALRDTFYDLKLEEKELLQGMIRYPESTVNLKKAIENKGIECWVFADLLEITEKAWQNAVEGWLNTQRFNLIVAENDFQKALEVYNGLPKNTAGVGIPNLSKMHGTEILPGSLAEIIDVSSPLARRYCVFLLGEVIMTDIKNLKEYPKSITKECMKYNSHTASRIKEKVYSRWFIGKAAREQQLKKVQDDLVNLDKQIEKTAKLEKDLEESIEISKRVISSLYEIKEFENYSERISAYKEDLENLDKQMESIDTSTFDDLKQKIASLRREIDITRTELTNYYKEKGMLEEQLKNTDIAYASLSEEKDNASKDYTEYEKEYADKITDFNTYFSNRIKKHPGLEELEKVLSNYEPSIKGMLTKQKNILDTLRTLKHGYNIRYNTYMQEYGDNSEQFLGTLKRYIDTELPEYKEKIAKARKEAEYQFKEHFVSRLNEYITEAKDSFSELNHTLKRILFGRDMYRFTIEEKQEKKTILKAISKASRVSEYEGTIFEQLTEPEQKESVEKLFNSITQSELDSDEVRNICDYRQYFTYDIKIKHTQTIDSTGKPLESTLSKVLREKSGGETQTPYYVAIAASFYRYFKDDEHAVRLVLFDEAFNKMDDDRIGNMVNFFKELGMQIVTAVPTEKIEIIAPYMSKINLIIRNNYSAYIRDYELLKEEVNN